MIPKILHVFSKGAHYDIDEACLARMQSMHPLWAFHRYSTFEEADSVKGWDS